MDKRGKQDRYNLLLNEDIENECVIYGMKWECLKLRSNTLHAKFVAFSRTEIEIQQLQKVIEKIEIVSDRVNRVSENSGQK